MRKWRLPLTYQPKIESVKKGDCRQTLRVRNTNKKTGKLAPRKEIGDKLQFFMWSGRPYYSSPVTITEYFTLNFCPDIKIFPWGILFLDTRGWANWKDLDYLARFDGIEPATGEELGRVLQQKNKIPEKGIPGQILRW